MSRGLIAIGIVIAAGYSNPARGQVSATTLVIGLENVVEYQVDTSDLSKWGTNPNVTSGSIGKGVGIGCSGFQVVVYGDIVSVNGDPARGTYIGRGVGLCMSPTPTPGVGTIADVSANSLRDETYYILQSDGITPIGTIMVNGLNGSVSPLTPGPPPGGQDFAIVGGTGAFLGARGQKGSGNGGLTGNLAASITEDPANRRQHGGGHGSFTFYVIPMFRPKVVITPNGPAITHSTDFSLVSSSKPATAGEILSLFATGLGPTRTSLAPGQPFPSNPLAVVNSPVALTVNGKAAEVLSAVGYPGAVDGYQVNFRLPPDTTKGTVFIQVSAAWISSDPVSIAVQ
ncbi:MAG: hypothetical protein JO307_27645 [Bryobacterales bacterium]|nr:hypothetical protein [Bryobacterales bacterium]MBV9398948.1 hypothetical protein [Bryobacterales bacterium]